MDKLLKKIASRLKSKEKQEDYKLSEENALEEICRFLEYYDIDMSRLEVTKNTEAAGESILNSLVRYFRLGKLKIEQNEKDFFVVQTLESGTEIRYKEPTAKIKRIMDKCAPDENRTKLYIFMGALTEKGIGLDGIDQLNVRDLAVLEVLGNLFLLA